MGEDLKDIGTRCYQFSLMVFDLIKSVQIDPIFKFLVNQLLRSATSIGANVIEGKSSSSRKELARYYQIALKSANETKYWLCLLRDGNKLQSELFEKVLNEVEQLSRIIGKSVISLKTTTKSTV